MPIPAPRQIRTRRFPPSGSSVDVARGSTSPLPSQVPMTCSPMSAHWAWFSPEDHIDTGRLCSAGFRRYPRSPTSTLLCSPPTPCLRRPRLRFPLPVAYLDASACSVPCGRRHVRSPNVSCVGDGSPALRKTGMSRGEARASQVPGPSSSYVPWSNTPPDTDLSSPTGWRDRCGLQVIQHPGHPGR